MSSEIQRVVSEFDGHRVVTITHHGRPCWLVSNVEEALGYSRGALGDLMRREWNGEFIEGNDFDVIRGVELNDLRAALAATGDYTVAEKTRHITVLYESGLNLVCLKTDKPSGARLRRLLATEVLPSIHRTGAYVAPGATEVPKLVEAVASLTTLVTTLCGEVRESRAELAVMRNQLNAPGHPHGAIKPTEANEVLAAFRGIATTRTDVDPKKATPAERLAWHGARSTADHKARRASKHPMGRPWSELEPEKRNAVWESIREQRKEASDEADKRAPLLALARKRSA